jgi:formamidopyrimidine-DNA glycosylase
VPELPDLEAIQDFLLRELVGAQVESVQVLRNIPLRVPSPDEFASQLTGRRLTAVRRRGKFLLLDFDDRLTLALNPMLTGRLRYCDPRERRKANTCVVLSLNNGRQLRYYDAKLMGKLYLLPSERLHEIPRWEEMGPEALDPAVTLEVFSQRLRRHPGQVKNILVNDTFLAGIGNAYADEILFAAGIYPYRRRSTLGPGETAALYGAMHRVLEEAGAIVVFRMGEDIHHKIRDFLQVHGKGGQPCPRCGAVVSQITANQRLTNFCRHCQV